MRNEKLPTILVLTSVNPHKGPAVVAETAYQAFLHQGFDVDFMCPYPVDGHPEYLHIYNGKKNKDYTDIGKYVYYWTGYI